MSSELMTLVTPEDLLMTASPFSVEQLAVFYQKTPADKIATRPAKGGGEWDYIQTGYCIDTLNRVFGYLWSFEVMTTLEDAAKMAGSGAVIVKGRLTVITKDGLQLVKEQFGRCEVKFRKGSKEFLDLGNDMKGAASDALKKCASEFGLFRDVYHKNDFEELNVISVEEKENRKAVAIDEAKAKLEKAKDVAELKNIYFSFPQVIWSNKEVEAKKDEMKQRLSKITEAETTNPVQNEATMKQITVMEALHENPTN